MTGPLIPLTSDGGFEAAGLWAATDAVLPLRRCQPGHELWVNAGLAGTLGSDVDVQTAPEARRTTAFTGTKTRIRDLTRQAVHISALI